MPGEVLDSTVLNIAVNLTSATVSTAGFGIPLILSADVAFSERIRTYDSAADLAADTDASLATTTLEYKMAAAFNQNGIGQFKVGRIDAGDSDDGDALAAIAAVDNDWYGLVTVSRVKADILAVAADASTLEKFYLAQSADADLAAGTASNVADTLKTASNNRAMVLYYSDSTVAADAAWLAAFLRANPDNTSTTAAHKTLVGIAIDEFSATERAAILADNGNVYGSLKGLGATFDGKMAGGLYADQILIRDWHKARLEEKLSQLLLDVSNANRKVPANAAGIAMVEAVFRERHAAGTSAGHFEEEDFTFSATADKATRAMSVTSGEVLTGAVHTITSTVTLATE